jgi:hypothetical protein
MCEFCTRLRYRLQAAAQYVVRKAIFEGRIPRLDGSVACADCSKAACDYDHRDYNRPLDVVPTCRSCNRKRGYGLPFRRIAA